MFAILAAGAALVLAGLFVRSADSGTGWAYRFVQRIYYRFGSLEGYQKSGRTYASAREALASGGAPVLRGLLERVAPSQVGWFSARFPTDKGHYHDYVSHYDVLFAPYRERGGAWLLEVGVKKGGSLVLWRELFDERSFIYGMDVNPDVPLFTRDGHVKVLVLDSTDAVQVGRALRGLRFDVIIDDGLHTPEAQLGTFRALLPFLAPDGVYVIEDVYSIDLEPYRESGLGITVHEDPSGQQLVVLYPSESLARNTALWSEPDSSH
jgi:hypothetical protein